MVGTNGDDDMSSNACNERSRLLRGEGDLTDMGLLVGVGHGRVEERSCLWIPTGLRWGYCWVARARSGGRIMQGCIFLAQGGIGR